ncbi:MAG TPA: alpha/beta hydrolase [Spirochaetota bacterium]|nr:alpha/beta hydrolase [Spirochaetota bacterium]
MRHNTKISVLTVFLVLAFFTASLQAMSPRPPAQATVGYGSTANYICSGHAEYSFGSLVSGTKCYYYIPRMLKNGSRAPVVVFLHGMILLAPEIYQAHINHLTKQGYIVIFPQFQPSILTLMFEMDQEVWLARAVDSVSEALERIGARADQANITLYGHSLGGLLAYSWQEEPGAPIAKNIVLSNPCFDMMAAMPADIPGMDWLVNLFINQIDYRAKAAAIHCPVILMTGNNDTIAPDWTAVNGYNEMINALTRVLYRFNTDTYGDPDLRGDHMASISDDGWMPSWMMELFGGDGEVDAVDYRYYWAGLDAALRDEVEINFNMGKWSDGRAVNPVETLAKDL